MNVTPVSIVLNGKRLTIDAPVGGVIARAWTSKRWYEFPLLEYIRALKLRGTVVDAGANIGNHTLWFALACGLKVEAFEPLHGEILHKNVMRNRATDKVRIHRVALGSEATIANHLGKGALQTGAGEIPVKTLDSFGLRGIIMIKADVEFMEPDVLRGGAETIQRDHPIIFSEVHPGREELLAAVLRPMGYALHKRFRSKFNPTPIEEWRWVK